MASPYKTTQNEVFSPISNVEKGVGGMRSKEFLHRLYLLTRITGLPEGE